MRIFFSLILCVVAAGCQTARLAQNEPEPVQVDTSPIEQQPLRLASHASDSDKSADEITQVSHQVADGEEPRDVEHFVQLALERNPRIHAARRKMSALTEVVPQVTSLDDPVLSDTFYPISDNGLQTAAGRMPNALTVSQKFPSMHKICVRGQIAIHDTQIAVRELEEAELAVAEEVRLACYEVAYHQRAIAITKASRNLLNDLLRFAEARYRTGGSQQDVIRAQLEIDNLDSRLVALKKMLAVAQADLAAAIHSPREEIPETLDELPEISVPSALDELYESAEASRPELQKWLQAVVKAERTEELASLDYYPDVTLGIAWQAISENNAISPVANSRDNVGLTIGVNLPIWQDKLDAGVREAQHRRVEMSHRYEASRDEVFRQIRRLVAQTQSLDEQINLYRRENSGIIARAQQALRISTADYRVNKVDFQQIIDNWNSLLMFELQAARLEANLRQSLASLERHTGTTFNSASSKAGS